MFKPIQAQAIHPSLNQNWMLTSDRLIHPADTHYLIPIKPPISNFEFQEFSRTTRSQTRQVNTNNNDKKGRKAKLIPRERLVKLTQQAKIERRVNPLLIPIRILLALLRILLLPLRILLAPLIVLLRAIVQLLRVLFLLINPFFIAFQIFNIARIIELILRTIFERIFRRMRKHREEDVKVITLKEEDEHWIHHWPIPKWKPPIKHGKRKRIEPNEEFIMNTPIINRLFPMENAPEFNMLQSDFRFITDRLVGSAYYPPVAFIQQSMRANYLPSG